jgi:hypothetical protein
LLVACGLKIKKKNKRNFSGSELEASSLRTGFISRKSRKAQAQIKGLCLKLLSILSL